MLEWNFKNDTTNKASRLMLPSDMSITSPTRLKAENTGLLLWGDVGTGKSFVAGCIANALIEKEIPVVMTNFAIILADMMNLKIDKNSISRLKQKQPTHHWWFWYGTWHSFALEQIYNIIDSRYTASKPLIMTTNLNHAEMLKTRYTRPIIDTYMTEC